MARLLKRATHLRTGYRRPRPAVALLILLMLTAGACQRRGDDASPSPSSAPPPPDLRGARVMLLPVRAPAPEQLDAELAFWLTDRSPTTDWVLPAELQAAVDRIPTWRIRLDAMPRPLVDLGGGERRVRDPLYGILRQLGAVMDASYAVLPLIAAEVPDSAGAMIRVPVAVVDIRGGRVLWLHEVRGERNRDPRVAVASVAEAVARALFP